MTTTTRERFEAQFDSPYMAEMLEFIETIEKEAKESWIQQGREEMKKECLACVPESRNPILDDAGWFQEWYSHWKYDTILNIRNSISSL